MTYIKICGIRSEDIAMGAAEAGADFIRLVFTPSPRQVTPEIAAQITSILKKNKAKAKSVGVFVNMPIASVKKIADKCWLDWVQLSGDESWKYCQELGRPFIKTIRYISHEPADVTGAKITAGKKLRYTRRHMVLLDTAVNGRYGGTGRPFPWKLAKPIVTKHSRLIIAGGLKSGNVGQAIKTLKPWGVDVSSGVETKGVKDMRKIIKFIKAVREADDSQT
jgi:phosphoribosylanthranilate isomerase